MKNTKIIAIANQKGGVGKTTTAVNIGAALGVQGFKVLLVDLDSQGSLSNYMGHEYDPDKNTINEIMGGIISRQPVSITTAVCRSEENKVDYIPADVRFGTMDMSLVNVISRETVLKRALEREQLDYDYIILDCSPNYGIVLYNALTAANHVIIPVQAQKMALDGVNLTIDTINEVQGTTNPDLNLMGVMATMVENTNMSISVVDYLSETFGERYLGAVSKSVKAQYSSYNNKALVFEKKSKHGEEYVQLAERIKIKVCHLDTK